MRHYRILASWILAALLLASLPAQAALIGYWTFDEGTGTAANDTSGRASPLNGTLSGTGGGPIPAWIAGQLGNALDFNQGSPINSAGGLVTVPYNVDLRLNSAFTISLWYRPDYTPAASTYPGIVRIGSQGATTGTDIGWGFFRSSPNRMIFKRGNVQPDQFNPALTVGQWHHIGLTYNGSGANVAFVNGVATPFTQTWLACTTSGTLQIGRMDQFDNAALDDLALFNEAISQPKMRSLYTVPTSLGLNYNLAAMRAMWAIYDGGPGSSGVAGGATWSYTTSLPGSTTPGDAYMSGNDWYVVLGTGSGVTAKLTLLGDFSPAGIGLPGTYSFTETPTIGTTVRFIFDLGNTTTVGGGVNDLVEVAGDLNLVNNVIVINPLAPLANGTYRLFNYTGNKTGAFNPTIVNGSRYTVALDETTPGQVNLTVSGSNADLQWASTNSSDWNLAALNWTNLGTAALDHFAQGDTVRFDDSDAYQTNITLNMTAFPSSMSVDSSALNYSFSGSGKISGLSGGLVKNGTGMLTLGTANDFLGPVQVNAGIVRAGRSTAFGAASGTTTIASGATLDIGGMNLDDEHFTVSGAGVGGNGAILNSGATPPNFWGIKWLTLAGDTVISAPSGNRWDICRVGGQLVGNGYSLTKIGAGVVDIGSAGETDLGDIYLLAGGLYLDASTTLGRPGNLISLAPGTLLQSWATGGNILNKVMYMTNATFQSAGGPITNVFAGPITLYGTNTFDATANAALALLNTVDGEGALQKIGPEFLALLGANTYTGDTLVNAGALALVDNGSIADSKAVMLASGSSLVATTRVDGTFTLSANQILGGSGTVIGSVVDTASGPMAAAAAAGDSAAIIPGGKITLGTLSVAGDLTLNGGTTLDFDLTGTPDEGGGTNDLINVAGNVTFAGVSTLHINPLANLDTVNQYTLFSYGGALTGNDANFSCTTDSRYNFTLDTGSTAGKVKLNVTGASADLLWAGVEPGAETLWDLKTTANWSDGLNAAPFYYGDGVRFDDFALTFDVELVDTLVPKYVIFDNDMEDYTLTGSGRLSGVTGLTKNFSARLIVANSGVNNYTGPTVINAGTVQVGTGGTVGSLGTGIITNNATLELNRSDDLTFANAFYGTGNLVKQNTNTLNLGSSSASYDGTITVNGGTLRPTAANALGTAAGSTVIKPGARLEINNLNLGVEPVAVAGDGVDGNGAIVNSGGGQNNALQFVTLNGDATFGGSGRWDIRNPGGGASLTGQGFAVTKTSANQVSFVGLGETDLGDIHVNQGTLSIESTTTLGRPANTVTIESNATLMFWGSTVPAYDKQWILNNGRILKDSGNATNLGPITLNESGIIDVNAASFVQMGPVAGTGLLRKNGSGTLFLGGASSPGAGTLVNAGTLQVGVSNENASLTGPVTLNSTTLAFLQTNAYTHSGSISGPGTVVQQGGSGPLTLAGSVTGPTINIQSGNFDNPLIFSGTAVVDSGAINVGPANRGGKLVVEPGASINVGNLMLGQQNTQTGQVVQAGGTVTVTNQFRIAHWPNNVSTYLMAGGVLNLTATPAAVPGSSGTEQNGVLHIGIDGVGVFTQTDGLVSTPCVLLDNRAQTVLAGASPHSFIMEGGTLNLGPYGIRNGNNGANTNYVVSLGGGTIASSANSTSVVNMTLSGVNGNVTFDTGPNTNLLSGALSGPGGLTKTGGGVLALTGNSTYSGATLVNDGALFVSGTLGTTEVTVAGGTLAGTGTLNGPVVVGANGTLVPGTSIGTLTVSNDLTLGGHAVFEVNKTGATITSDRVAGVYTLNYGGTLTVVATGDALSAGDTVKLFEATNYRESFAAFDLPNLGGNLIWDKSGLAVDGTLKVIELLVTIGTPTLSGTNLTLSGTGGLPGATYRVIATTDVSQPLVSWATVSTGTFDGSGSFSATIGIDPAEPQRFYLVVLP